MYRSNSRGQTEIIGLAIIVILIILGLTYYIVFQLNQEPNEIKRRASQSAIATNMISTLIDTTSSSCNELTFGQLLQNCGNAGPNIPTITCNGQYSCDYVASEFTSIFSRTLDEWGFTYFFRAGYAGTDLTAHDPVVIGTPCPGEKTQSRPFPLPTTGGQLIVTLDICA